LKTVFSEVFVEAVNGKKGAPRHIDQAELSTDTMDLAARVAEDRVTTSGISDLPGIVAGRADIEQEFLVLAQGKILA
jgi:hypothetical protein